MRIFLNFIIKREIPIIQLEIESYGIRLKKCLSGRTRNLRRILRKYFKIFETEVGHLVVKYFVYFCGQKLRNNYWKLFIHFARALNLSFWLIAPKGPKILPPLLFYYLWPNLGLVWPAVYLENHIDFLMWHHDIDLTNYKMKIDFWIHFS